jgi:hypothetical protein
MEEVRCSFCHEQFAEPRVLSCSHTFCTDCIHQLAGLSVLNVANNHIFNLNGSQPNTIIDCPTCSAKEDISSIDNLPIDEKAQERVEQTLKRIYHWPNIF